MTMGPQIADCKVAMRVFQTAGRMNDCSAIMTGCLVCMRDNRIDGCLVEMRVFQKGSLRVFRTLMAILKAMRWDWH